MLVFADCNRQVRVCAIIVVFDCVFVLCCQCFAAVRFESAIVLLQVTTRLRKAGLLDAIGKDHFHDSLEVRSFFILPCNVLLWKTIVGFSACAGCSQSSAAWANQAVASATDER